MCVGSDISSDHRLNVLPIALQHAHVHYDDVLSNNQVAECRVLQGRAQLLLGDCALKLDANSSSSGSGSGRSAAAELYRAARSTFHSLKDTNAVSSTLAAAHLVRCCYSICPMASYETIALHYERVMRTL
jgi:hypothetical protein